MGTDDRIVRASEAYARAVYGGDGSGVAGAERDPHGAPAIVRRLDHARAQI